MSESAVARTATSGDALQSDRISPRTLVRLALRLLWRDWQGGELRLLFLALVMAVASVTGIALFTDRLEQALLLESANMLAADRVLSGRQPAPEEWMEEARQRNLRTAEILSFSSMAFSDQGNLLVAAKAVSDDYPLRGELMVADEPFQSGSAAGGGPAEGEVWVESRVLSALQIDVGDTVHVGEAEFQVSRIIVMEPDRQQGGMIENAGPRLMLNLADVPETEVLQPGSRVSYRYLFAGDTDQLEAYADWVGAESAGEYRLRDVRDESEEISEALSRGESFLMLGSLFAVLLAGVAIALTARRYSERHFDYVAILKTLGCTSSQISAIYLTIQCVLALLAVLIGSILGWAVHYLILELLESVIDVDLPSAGLRPFAIGALTAVICLLSFALPPLLALKNTSPLRVLRKDLDEQTLGDRMPYLFGLTGSIVLVLWYSQDLLLTSILVLAVGGIVLTLSAFSLVLLKSGTSMGMRAGSALKLAMSAIRRRRRQTVLQIIVFAITIMSLLILTLLRTDLIEDWQGQLPENTPNHFLMNVTTPQVEGIQAFFEENGIEANDFFPMVSGSIVEIDPSQAAPEPAQAGSGQALTAVQTQSGAEGGPSQASPEPRQGSRRVTWVEELPPDNRIVAGSWWGEEPEPGFVSVEEDYADRLGLELGDVIEFEVGGEIVPVTVSSLRSVRWDNMQPNFFFIFSPGTLDYLGATYLSTVLLEQEQKMLLNDLMRQFPTIVVIEIDAIIEQIQNIISQVTSAIELISLLVLICGALVLLACVNATLDERFHENAILRTLGAGKKLIMSSLVIEFAAIGAMAGLIATLGAEASLYYLQREVFGQDFSLHYWVWFAGPLSGMVLISLLGVLYTKKVVNISPLNVLRNLA